MASKAVAHEFRGVLPPITGRLASSAVAQANSDARFESELIGLLPHIRAFARSLTGNAAQADDLSQEAMLNAWRARASYLDGQQHEGLDLQDPAQSVFL